MTTQSFPNPEQLRSGLPDDHRRDVYSQNGEDGIIAALLSRLPQTDRWCVEFGAWDGRYLSNVNRLIEQESYRALMIEADLAKFEELKNNHPGDNVIKKLGYVGFDAADNLEHFLANTSIPGNFDLLSIDIDGNDYHVWNAIKNYRPKIVCIEFNPTIAIGVYFVQPADPATMKGSSASSLVELANQKGYRLIASTAFNLFFIVNELVENVLPAGHTAPSECGIQTEVTHIFYGYDGAVHLSGRSTMLWHGVPIDARHLQLLPRRLQHFPDNLGWFRRWQLNLLCRWRQWGLNSSQDDD